MRDQRRVSFASKNAFQRRPTRTESCSLSNSPARPTPKEPADRALPGHAERTWRKPTFRSCREWRMPTVGRLARPRSHQHAASLVRTRLAIYELESEVDAGLGKLAACAAVGKGEKRVAASTR